MVASSTFRPREPLGTAELKPERLMPHDAVIEEAEKPVPSGLLRIVAQAPPRTELRTPKTAWVAMLPADQARWRDQDMGSIRGNITDGGEASEATAQAYTGSVAGFASTGPPMT